MSGLRMALCMVFAAVMLLTGTGGAMAQRRINPVKSASAGIEGKNENKNTADSIDYSKLVRSQDANGNVVLVDTVTGREVADTTELGPTQKIPKMMQPLFYSAAVSVNIWDPVMRLFGQHYGLIEFSGELNLHNRYIPVVEIGLGESKYTPEDNNYTYKVGLTPYFRVGANYNFLYNSNPDYMVTAGLRYGWTKFNYEINDVKLTDGYWDESTTFNLPRQSSSVSYLQVLFGIRVKLFGPISAGWSFRYQTILKESKAEYGKPWYIPGYGSRKSSVTGTFSITYTLPLKKRSVNVPDELITLPDGGIISNMPEPTAEDEAVATGQEPEPESNASTERITVAAEPAQPDEPADNDTENL